MNYLTPKDRLALGCQRFNDRPAKRALNFNDIHVTVEVDVGSVLSGIGEDGKPWANTFTVPYGYIKNTNALHDGDSLDCFIWNDPRPSAMVYVIWTRHIDGSLNQPKCMLGFPSENLAVHKFRENSAPWAFGDIDILTYDQFRHGFMKAFHDFDI